MIRAAMALLLVLAALLAWLFIEPAPSSLPSQNQSTTDLAELRARGAYLARVGDCAACHNARGGAPYAGGRPLVTDYGTFYSSNLTPDAATGLGRWSADDFWNALHHGLRPDGQPLYTAFPYDSYTRVTRADADALFAYLQALPPVHAPQRAHELHFPYDQRWLLRPWRRLFFSPGVFEPDANRDAAWNRGAYLVQGLGHCSSCHAPRNLLGATRDELDLPGAVMPGSSWYAPPLLPGSAALAGELAERVQLLHAGQSPRAVATGPMAEVVYNSLQYLQLQDIEAMLRYLRERPTQAEPVLPRHLALQPAVARAQELRGAVLYERHCAECHQAGGEGVAGQYPPLAGNPDVTGAALANLVQVMVNGGYAPGTAAHPRPYGMPPYGGRLSDEELADVLTYVRRAWGNEGSAVSPVDVARLHAPPQW